MATVQTSKKTEGGFGRYIRGVRTELKKVIWPNKEKLVKYSALVILLSIISALVISIFDLVIINILQLIIG